MEKENIKIRTEKAIKIMEAFLNGATIQFSNVLLITPKWQDVVGFPNWDWRQYDYRIKPHATYRSYNSPKECISDVVKNHPDGWLKKKGTEEYVRLTEINQKTDFMWLFEFFTYADGSTFGVKN